jgi:Kef-type K+ transport system membrane component KefB
VVLELLAGIVLGPNVLGLHVGDFIAFFSDLGLGLLFFFAGDRLALALMSSTQLPLVLAITTLAQSTGHASLHGGGARRRGRALDTAVPRGRAAPAP